MAKFRRLAALLACVVMATSAAGCADTRYSAKIGDDEVKAGVYIAYVNTLLSNELTMLYYQGITDNYFEQQVDGVSLSQYIKDGSLKSLKEYCAITKQFDAEGLVITDEEMKQVNANVKTSWDNMGALYEYEGVSKESLKELYLVSLKKEKLFDHYYEEGGKEPVSDDELQKFINEHYMRYKIITIYNSSETDEEKKKAENEEKQKLRDKYYDDNLNISFEDFDKIIDEYKAYTEAQSASNTTTDDSSTGDSSSNSEVSSETSSEVSSSETESKSDDTSSEADTSSDASSESDDSQASNDASSDESSETESSSSSEEDSSSQKQDDSSDSNTDDSKTETETDPYANEVMMNYDNYKDDTESASGKLYKFINEMEVGKIAKFDSDYGYYLIIKGDVSERTDYLSANRDSVLHAAKDEAFQAMLDNWVASAGITINDKAIKRYTPEVIYDRMNEYYDKNKSNS